MLNSPIMQGYQNELGPMNQSWTDSMGYDEQPYPLVMDDGTYMGDWINEGKGVNLENQQYQNQRMESTYGYNMGENQVDYTSNNNVMPSNVFMNQRPQETTIPTGEGDSGNNMFGFLKDFQQFGR